VRVVARLQSFLADLRATRRRLRNRVKGDLDNSTMLYERFPSLHKEPIGNLKQHL
jgi:hypothetical protein